MAAQSIVADEASLAPPPPPAAEAEMARLQQDDAPTSGWAAAAGEIIREEFPATLFFRGEIPLDGQGVANVEIPLADALTTYRLEAIAWTASGWTTSSMARLRVDQEAMVDAPVPPFATIGDHLDLPVRVANRTDDPLPVRVEVEAEGDLSLESQEVTNLTVPPREAIEAIVQVRLGTVGEGSLLIRALHGTENRSLDAVRRPLHVFENVRLLRERREEVLEAGDSIRIEIPDRASPRGPGELRLVVGSGLFGEPSEWGVDSGYDRALWAGWALAASEREIPEEIRSTIVSSIPARDDQWYGPALRAALTMSSLWRDDRLSDELIRSGLVIVSNELPPEGSDPEMASEQLVWLLLAMAPTFRDAEHRSALQEELERIEGRLRRLVSSRAARATEAPVEWIRAGAALALVEPGTENARALEMIRRASRSVISVGDEAWLEPTDTDGTILPRVEPTALLALSRVLANQDRQSSMRLLRSLIRVIRTIDSWPTRSRAIASAAAALLTGSNDEASEIRVLLDGRALEVRREGGISIAQLDGIGTPGTHEIDVRLGRDQIAVAWVDLRYGLPWDVRPRMEAPIRLDWSGPVGARDGRAGLRLEVRNQGPRILTNPIVEIELPAGTELDEPTREALESQLIEPATLEDRTLVLHLRPLAPGGYIRLPLPLRWALGGTLIGLGASVWDETGPMPLAARPTQILPSRGITVANRGEQPETPDLEVSPAPEPRPFPLPPLRPVRPLGEVLR